MSIKLEPISPNSGAYIAGMKFESEQQISGDERPVVKVGESALPTGAATATNQTDGTHKTQIVNPAGDVSEVMTGPFTGEKGLRVFIGHTDPISDIPVFLDYDQHQIHEGETWHWDILISNLASGANKDIVFTVPDITLPPGVPAVARCPHFRYEVNTNDLAQYVFFEAPTVTAATGTARTPINLERNGTYTPQLEILESPTITATGTQIDAEYFLSASTNQNKASNSGRAVDEIILKNNTKYLFRVTSGASGCDIHIDFRWYQDLGV